MGYYVIIRGPLGVGKSVIAQKLAKTLKAVYIPIDLFKTSFIAVLDVLKP
jgi:deoxyadenosine/deoxycytidine kinase